jgi:hypothetical protein
MANLKRAANRKRLDVRCSAHLPYLQFLRVKLSTIMSSMLSRMVFDGRQLQHRRSTATHHRLVVGVVEWRVDLVVCVSDLLVRSSTWALREKLLSREILVDKNGLTDLVRHDDFTEAAV